MRTDYDWHTMTDGDWHPLPTGDPVNIRASARRWGNRYGYKASINNFGGDRQIRFTPQRVSWVATQQDLDRFAAGKHLEPTREQEARCRELTPETWTALLDAGERRDGAVCRFATEHAVRSLRGRHLIAYRSLTPKALRVLGRDAEADHLVSVGAECLADLHDRTFVPGSRVTSPEYR